MHCITSKDQIGLFGQRGSLCSLAFTCVDGWIPDDSLTTLVARDEDEERIPSGGNLKKKIENLCGGVLCFLREDFVLCLFD